MNSNQNRPTIALIYDFDKTLSPINALEHGFYNFIGMQESKSFFKKIAEYASQLSVSIEKMIMYFVLHRINKRKPDFKKEDFLIFGKEIKFYKGLTTWFERINEKADKIGVNVEHHIVSCNFKQIIKGCDIAKEFTSISGSDYTYNENGQLSLPVLGVSGSIKPKVIKKICNNTYNSNKSNVINISSHNKRTIPLNNVIYIGDSVNDIPAFNLVNSNGGKTIGVFNAKSKHLPLKGFYNNGNLTAYLAADYSKNSELENIVEQHIIEVKEKAMDLDDILKDYTA